MCGQPTGGYHDILKHLGLNLHRYCSHVGLCDNLNGLVSDVSDIEFLALGHKQGKMSVDIGSSGRGSSRKGHCSTDDRFALLIDYYATTFDIIRRGYRRCTHEPDSTGQEKESLHNNNDLV